jgi:hypothetical protein
MPRNLYVKNSGTFTVPKYVYVKNSGSWVSANKIYTKVSGVWTQTYPETGSQNFTSSGSFTVPIGVKQLTITMAGASGGGGGGGNSSAGLIGGTSFRDIRTINVNSGETLTITVGSEGQGGRSGIANCGSNAAAWDAINNDPAQRKGYGGAGYASGGAGSGYGCPNSFNATGGWSGGGGGSSAYVYSGGTIVAGGGSGGDGGKTYDGGNGTGGSGGNSGSGNQGASGVTGGAGQTSQFSGYGGDGSAGYVNISW